MVLDMLNYSYDEAVRARGTIILAMAMVVLCGCTSTLSPFQYNIGNKDERIDMEQLLGTSATDSQKQHALVYYPFEHALRFPGLVIGVEQSDAKVVRAGFNKDVIDENVLSPNGSYGDRLFRSILLEQTKVMFISHVIRTRVLSTSSDEHWPIYADPHPCFLFNDYQTDNKPLSGYRTELDSIKFCDDTLGNLAGPLETDYFKESWAAIDRVRKVVQEELRPGNKYTHVVVIVMGWNTQQIEALQNINSIVDRLAQTVPIGEAFRPYVIGVTWPSGWNSEWLQPIAKGASLVYKANDADELGGGWLGALMQYGVLPVTGGNKTTKVPLVVIGHSFGARATSYAVCRPTFFRKPDSEESAPDDAKVNWLIGLGGAYSLNRFSENGAGILDVMYPDKCPRADRLIFTTSKNDEAANAGSVLDHAHFAGSLKTYNQICAAQKEGVPLGTINVAFRTYKVFGQSGVIEDDPVCANNNEIPERFYYIDASDVLKYKAFSTGGGAHSDIYRNDTAKVIWKVIQYSQAKQKPQ